jgi:hypothetical protein
MQQHLILFFQFLLAKILSVVLAFELLNGLSKFDDFLFLLGYVLEVIWLPDEHLVWVIDDLSQFNVLCL